MAVETARQWRRSDSEETHSVRRSQASSRESRTDMVVTLAGPSGLPRTRPPMEKFVIDGGQPLSGTVIPAGNKNAALPILAASALTADEGVVRNVPRIRDGEAMLRILEGPGGGGGVRWGAGGRVVRAGLARPPRRRRPPSRADPRQRPARRAAAG